MVRLNESVFPAFLHYEPTPSEKQNKFYLLRPQCEQRFDKENHFVSKGSIYQPPPLPLFLIFIIVVQTKFAYVNDSAQSKSSSAESSPEFKMGSQMTRGNKKLNVSITETVSKTTTTDSSNAAQIKRQDTAGILNFAVLLPLLSPSDGKYKQIF